MMQFTVIIFAQTPRINIDHLLQIRQITLNFEHFVHLFLIVSYDKARATVSKDITHLLGHRILIKRHGYRAHHLRRHHRPVKRRPIATNNCNKVAFFYANLHKSKRKISDDFFNL